MDLKLGTVLRCNIPPRHPWIILSDPQMNGGDFLFVNFTTLKDSSLNDECIIEPSEYPGVLTSAKSTMAFLRSHVGNIDALQKAIDDHQFVVIRQPIPKPTLDKIIHAARNTNNLSDAKKRLLPPPSVQENGPGS